MIERSAAEMCTKMRMLLLRSVVILMLFVILAAVIGCDRSEVTAIDACIAGVIEDEDGDSYWRHSYIDTKGRVLFSLDNDEHLSASFYCNRVRVKRSFRGFIRRDGTKLKTSEPISFIMQPFSCGHAVVVVDHKCAAVLDTSGKIKRIGLSAISFWVSRFHNDIALVYDQDSELFTWLSIDGELLCEPKYEAVGFFNEGLAYYVTDVSEDRFWDPMYGYIRRDGTLLTGAKYSYASYFSEGLAAVCEAKEKARVLRIMDGDTLIRLGSK